tara:strand:- start:76127 stop:76390 length:264 start_codon:yes stop_codon:yes gene_type:complete
MPYLDKPLGIDNNREMSNLQPMFTFEDVVKNKDSIKELKCVTTHTGVSREILPQGGVRWVFTTYEKDNIVRRNTIVLNNLDYWVLNS